ncbi:extracellular solute-binding protein [Paenibacillus sp. LMG 31460]|uniref:Extracellular solute-binding protein n=1 Tax=Paenibacillus germinis TaxID=2654979 RepID=A0ABX1Z5R0_9BACL|nr:sugar ABC transporter substrate-binding protein [Paenibacillus germinis]NOU87604.1 extracellular solute-binding protein [Paenibacillus germinis]
MLTNGNRKMKSVLPVIVVGVMMVSVLGACGNSTTNNKGGNASASPTASGQPVATAPAKEPVTITAWSNDRSAMDVVTEQVKQFNSANKDVQINYVVQSDDYAKVLTLALQTNQAPDVFTRVGGIDYVKNKWVLPIEGLVDQKLISTLKPFTSGKSPDGKLYSLPTTAITSRLIYNKDLFRSAGLDPEKPPVTFSEMKAAAQKITEAGKGVSYGIGIPLKYVGYVDWGIDPLIAAGNGDLSSSTYNVKTGKFEMDKYKPAVEMVREIIKNKWAFPGASSLDNDPMRSAFADGKIGMFIAQTWDVGVLNDQFKSKADWGVAPLPVPDGTVHSGGVASTGGSWSIWSGNKHPKEAAKVFEFFNGSQMSQVLQKSGKIIALNPEAADPKFASNVKGSVGFLVKPNERSMMWPPSSFMEIKGKTYRDTIIELFLTDKPIEPALQQLNDTYNGAYDTALAAGKFKKEDYTR